jgi:zinc protease
MTYIDWTTYFETMPAPKIDLALRLEADRLQNSLFEEAEVASERTVIISERQGNENHPLFKLDEEMQATAFESHPYGHEVIGEMADLESMSRDDLYTHYKRYYAPNNAVLAMAGDFDAGQMLERVKTYFEGIPAGEEPERIAQDEHEPAEERRVESRGPGETIFVRAAYRAPRANHPDFFPLTVLDSLLSGPSNLNLFGGGISNKTSRLYKQLVESEKAVGVSGGLQATIDPFLYNLTVTVHPQRTAEDVIPLMDAEIARIQDEAPGAAELARAVKQAEALFAYGSESITNQGFWLGFAEMFANYGWFENYLKGLEAVTPEDVQRVAQTYLRPERRVLGIYVPEGRN